jgi:hypothetical protein
MFSRAWGISYKGRNALQRSFHQGKERREGLMMKKENVCLGSCVLTFASQWQPGSLGSTEV